MKNKITFNNGLVAMIILTMTLFLVDGFGARSETFYGNVVDKHYQAADNSIGNGLIVNSNGDTGVLTTYEQKREKFLLIVKTENGKIVTVKCEPELYYGKTINEQIECKAYKGLITGRVWSLRGVRYLKIEKVLDNCNF